MSSRCWRICSRAWSLMRERPSCFCASSRASQILRQSPTVLVDDKVQNLVPFLPLNDLNRAPRSAESQPGGTDRPLPLPMSPGGSGPGARVTGSIR